MAVVKRKDPSVVLLMEVLEGKQTKKLTSQLRLQGYKSIYVGKGHGYGRADEGVRLILATKQKSTTFGNFEFDLPRSPGNGGGIAAVRIDSLDCLVVGVHWPRKGFEKANCKYFEALHAIIRKNKCKKVLLIGDLNMTPEEIKENYPDLFVDSFSRLSLLSPNSPTCSNTFLINWFYSKCLDLVYGKGFKVVGRELVDTFSDHKAVYVEVR
jgi:exonuclease III